MLPVFNTFPCTTPTESMHSEKSVGKIGTRDFTREISRPVYKPCSCCGLNGDTPRP